MKGTHTIPGISDHDMIVVVSVIWPVIMVIQHKKPHRKAEKRDTQEFSREFMRKSPQQSVNENLKALKGHIEKIVSTWCSHVSSRMFKTRLLYLSNGL